jgi:hypothetical protein
MYGTTLRMFDQTLQDLGFSNCGTPPEKLPPFDQT